MIAVLVTKEMLDEAKLGVVAFLHRDVRRELPSERAMPCWCFYHDDEWDLHSTLPGDLAGDPEQALRVFDYADRSRLDGIERGRKIGRENLIEDIHAILGIDRIVAAIGGRRND